MHIIKGANHNGFAILLIPKSEVIFQYLKLHLHHNLYPCIIISTPSANLILIATQLISLASQFGRPLYQIKMVNLKSIIMKTQIMNSIKEITTVFMIAVIVTLVACGGEQASTAQVNNKEVAIETTTEKPSVDIHTAAFMGNLKAIQEHIKAGTDLNKKDQYGSTPLVITATFGKAEAAEALIIGGADLHIRSNDGATPLHIAAFFCRVDVVKALLAKGADKTLKNKYGSTSLESVSGSFSTVKGIYEQIAKDLGPLGLKFDFDYLEATRPKIAELLK